MKKIITGFCLALMLFAVSCTEMLEEKPKMEIDAEQFMNNAGEAEVVLLGCYRSLVKQELYAYNFLILQGGTDILQVGLNKTANFREVANNVHNSSNSYVLETWTQLYKAIYDANSFIETLTGKIGGFGPKDKELAELYIAEAKALRAMYYFELVRYFGNVALMKTTDESRKRPSEMTQSTPLQVYEFMEQDLLDALILPWSTEDKIRGNSAYRFSKGAVYGLLAKLYVTWAGHPVQDDTKWERAAWAAGEVIESGKHTLLPNFETLWENTCNGVWDPKESLIEISFYTPISTGSDAPSGRIGKFNGVRCDALAGVRNSNPSECCVVYSFVEDFYKQNDPRYPLSIATYRYDGAVKNNLSNRTIAESGKDASKWGSCTPAKWDVVKYLKDPPLFDNHRSNVNWYFMRYADLLLLYAEAVNEWKQGPTPEAYEAINRVRRRGFNKPVNTPAVGVDLPSGLDYAAFQKYVRDERGWELCFEGHRKPDLYRWGIYYETLQKTYNRINTWAPGKNYFAVFVATIEGKHELLPIPQRELDIMKQFKPNPGWGE